MTTQANIRGHRWWSRAGRLALATAAGLVTGHAGAATPQVFMESATIAGASDAVTLTRVPVQDANGKITYKNVRLFFSVDSFGALTLPPASIQITASPTINVGAFKPGTYNGYTVGSGSCGSDGTFKVGSPGVGSGGRISGSIQRISKPNCDSRDTFNASWTSGPIAGHPHQARLNTAGITSTAFNWGVMGTAGTATVSSGWKAGHIIGAIQNGNQLTLVNFGTDKNADTSLSFTLCPTASPC